MEQKRDKIKHFAQECGLMFFFRGDCPYCKVLHLSLRILLKSIIGI
ncbi:hypothetical protein MIDIC_10050 [Alphaproteobacteria bacterium]